MLQINKIFRKIYGVKFHSLLELNALEWFQRNLMHSAVIQASWNFWYVGHFQNSGECLFSKEFEQSFEKIKIIIAPQLEEKNDLIFLNYSSRRATTCWQAEICRSIGFQFRHLVMSPKNWEKNQISFEDLFKPFSLKKDVIEYYSNLFKDYSHADDTEILNWFALSGESETSGVWQAIFLRKTSRTVFVEV